MNKFLTTAVIAATLAIGMPMVAQADNYRHHENRGYRHDVYREHLRRDYRHMERHEFSHWRPGLERQHYRGFGRPVYYNDYYRVRAYDPRGRIVFINVNAYTGTILSVGF